MKVLNLPGVIVGVRTIGRPDDRKTLKAARQRRYYLNGGREKNLASTKAWRARNQERIREAVRKYQAINRERIYARRRELTALRRAPEEVISERRRKAALIRWGKWNPANERKTSPTLPSCSVNTMTPISSSAMSSTVSG